MRLFLPLALLFLSGMSDCTVLGSTLKPFHDMNMEEALKYLHEKILSLENRETPNLTQKIKGEVEDELTAKFAEMEVSFVSKHNDLSRKQQELEENASKQKESLNELSERFLKEKNERLSMDNHILMEVHQLQGRALETVEKVNTLKNEVTSASEGGRNRMDMLEVKINETKDLAHSCLASLRDTEGAIRMNMSSSAEVLKTLTNHTSEISSINARLIRVETVCDPPCENGGDCLKNNFCRCTPAFSGDRCQYDYVQCGLDLPNAGVNGSLVVGGNSSSGPWPWMAAVYLKGKSWMKCEGSTIHRRFILTSASCMYDVVWKQLDATDLTVRLGLTDTRDLTHLQERNVRTIHIHPLHYINPHYDYEISLLELEKPIDYDPFIRPVCLPPREGPEDNRFYEPQSSALVIGWETEGSDYILREYPHVIQPADICNETFETHSVDLPDRLFCAAPGAVACPVTSGRTVAMQSQPDGRGGRVWTQVGIGGPWMCLRAASGSRLYSFFVGLQQLMPWVEETVGGASSVGG